MRKLNRTIVCLAFLTVLGYLPWRVVKLLMPETWGSVAHLFLSIALIVALATLLMGAIGVHRYKWIVGPILNPAKFYGPATTK